MLPVLVLLNTVAVQTPAPPQSVAVFNFKSTTGVGPELGEVLASLAVTHTRKRTTFARVNSAAEVDALLGLERQRQLLDCDSTGCMAEIAGSLNVSHILTGVVSMVGSTMVLTVNLVPVKALQASSSVNRSIKGGTGEKALEVLPAALDELFAQAGVLRTAGEKPLWPKVMLGTGGVGVAAAGLALFSGVVGGAGALVFLGALYGLVPLDVRGMLFPVRMGVLVGLGGVAGVLLVVALATGVGAAGVLGGGVLGLVRE